MKMETNKMWQIFMLTILLTLAGCKNGGEYSQSVCARKGCIVNISLARD